MANTKSFSRLFLQSPANPDLLYIIVFSHTQLTITLLLVLIFGSKVGHFTSISVFFFLLNLHEKANKKVRISVKMILHWNYKKIFNGRSFDCSNG